jgi:hypothetical protein
MREGFILRIDLRSVYLGGLMLGMNMGPTEKFLWDSVPPFLPFADFMTLEAIVSEATLRAAEVFKVGLGGRALGGAKS